MAEEENPFMTSLKAIKNKNKTVTIEKYDEVDAFGDLGVKKKNFTPVLKSTSKPSSIGWLNDQGFQYGGNNPEIPTVLTNKGKIDYSIGQVKKTIERQNLSARLKKATGAYDASQGEGASDNIMQAQAKEYEAQKIKRNSFGTDFQLKLASGIDQLGRMVTSIPSSFVDLVTSRLNSPGNQPRIDAEYLGKLAEETIGLPEEYNPLSPNNYLSSMYKERAKANQALALKGYDGGITKALQDENYADAGKLMALGITESLPVMIGLLTSRGAGVSKGVSLFGMGLGTTGTTYEDLKESNPNINKNTLYINAVLTGIGEAGSELVGTSMLYDQGRKLFIKGAEKEAEEVVKKGIQGYLDKSFKKAFVGSAVLGDMSGEVANQVWKNATDKWSGVDPERDFLEGVGDAALISLGMTGGIASLTKGISKIVNPKTKQTITKDSEAINRLTSEIDNPNISSQEKEVLMSEVGNMTEKINDHIDEDSKVYNSLTDVQKANVDDLVTESEKIEQIINNPNISPETKAQLQIKLDGINKELDGIKPENKSAANLPSIENPDITVESGGNKQNLSVDDVDYLKSLKLKLVDDVLNQKINGQSLLIKNNEVADMIQKLLDGRTKENKQSTISGTQDVDSTEHVVKLAEMFHEEVNDKNEQGTPFKETKADVQPVSTETEKVTTGDQNVETDKVEPKKYGYEDVNDKEAGSGVFEPKNQNFTQFAKENGYPDDYDTSFQAQLLGGRGLEGKRQSNRSIKEQDDAFQAMKNKKAEGKKAYEQAILDGKVIDPDGKLTRGGILKRDYDFDKKELESKIANAERGIKNIEGFGKMSHLDNGKLKKGYQRAVDDYNEIISKHKETLSEIKTEYNKAVEQSLPTKEAPTKSVETTFKPFVDIVNSKTNVDEAFSASQNVKGVSQIVADAFSEKYNPNGDLSPKQAFTNFYNEVKGVNPETPKAGSGGVGDVETKQQIENFGVPKEAIKNEQGTPFKETKADVQPVSTETEKVTTGDPDGLGRSVRSSKEGQRTDSGKKDTRLQAATAERKAAVSDMLSFVNKSRGTLSIGADVATFTAKLAKVIESYAKEGIVKLVDVLSTMRDDFGDDFMDEHKYKVEEVHSRGIENTFTDKLKLGIESTEVAETLNNIERESGREQTQYEKEYFKANLDAAFAHGVAIVEAAKQEYGDNYVEEMLDYIAKNKVNYDSESLAIISLENDLEYRITKEFENSDKLEDQLSKVRKISGEMQRQKARGVAFGILRKIGRVGWEIEKVTKDFFSNKDNASRDKVNKAIKADGNDINKQAEENEQKNAESSIIDLKDVDVNEKQINKSKAKSIANYLRSLKSGRDPRAVLGSNNISAILDFFRDGALETVATTVELGGSVADGIKKAVKNIQAEQRKKNLKATDFDVLEKALTDDILGNKKEKSALTPAQRLEKAKESIRERMVDIKQQIADKKVELEARGIKFEKDAEYKSLVRQLKHINEQAQPFLTDKSKDLLDERKQKAIVTKLENEIADLDEQITQNSKKAKSVDKNPATSPLINDLKALKKVKQDLLNDIDPDVKEVVKSALIEAGYGREITVTTKEGKEKRTVLDWKELSTAQDISNVVDKVLNKQGYSQVQKDRMKVAIQTELNRIRTEFIEKNIQSELDRRNMPKSTESKTYAKRLAELYNYKLFDKYPNQYDYLLNSALGMSLSDQKLFFQAKSLAKSLAEVYQKLDPATGKKYSEFAVSEIISQINKQIENVLTKAVRGKASTVLNFMNILQAYIGGNLRNKLTGVRNITENILSGFTERNIQNLHNFMTNGLKGGKYDTKELRKSRKQDALKLIEDTILNAGGEYGGTGSPFVSKNMIMDSVNEWVDKGKYSKINHLITSIITVRYGLEGADSYNKIRLTEYQFQENMIRVLTDRSNPNKMSHEDARAYVSEKLTGQSKSDALEKAKNIIQEINNSAGKEMLKNNPQNVNRIANNLIKDALVNGQAITPDMIKASFNAAYKSAGRSIGHEANNFGTQFLTWANQRMDGEIRKAVKEEQWSKAAALQALQIINKNFINPFVGGGLNWTVLGLQKTGVPAHYLVDYNAYEKVHPIDVTTPDGIKELDRTLTTKANHNKDNARTLTGVVVTATIIGALSAWVDDEEKKKLRKFMDNHPAFEKAFTKLAHPSMVAYMAYGDKEGKFIAYIRALLNQRADTFNQKEMAFKATFGTLPKGNDAAGVLGNILGDKAGIPYLPTPFIRDVKELINEVKGVKAAKKSYKTKGFWNGFFKGGLTDVVGLRPKESPDKSSKKRRKRKD